MSKFQNLKAKLFRDGKPTKSFWVLLSNILVWSLIGTFLLIGGLRFADKKSGYKVLNNHVAVVVSDSMSKIHPDNTSYMPKEAEQLEKGDIIKAKEYKDYESVELYDVVIYTATDGNLIVHRVIDKYENNDGKWIVTKGDANSAIDTPVSFDIVRGKVIKKMAGAGKVVMFMQSPYFLVALFGSGFSILAGFLLVEIFGKKKKNDGDDNSPKNPGIPEKNAENPVKKDSKGRFVSTKVMVPFIGSILVFGTLGAASGLFVESPDEISFGIGASAPVVTYKTVYIETKYFFNSGSSSESVKAYCWSSTESRDNGWPGEDTTWVTDLSDGKKIFSFDVNTTLYDRILFTKVVGGSAQLKTVDIEMSSFNSNNTVYLNADNWGDANTGIPVGFYTR